MSTKPRKVPPKNKPLPSAPQRALPSRPPPKPRAQTFNGPNPPKPQTTTTSNGGTFTYTTTTYYTTSQHPWSASSSNPSLQQSASNNNNNNNTNQKPATTITYYNTPNNANNGNRPPPMSFTTKQDNQGNTGYTVTYYSTAPGGGGNTQWQSQPLQTANHFQNPQRAMSPKASKHKPMSSYHKAMPLAPTVTNADINYSFGDAVDLNDNRQGTIRFIGEIAAELNGAVWYGIELRIAKGDNDGSLKGIQYFKCAENFGTFVQKEKIRWLTSGTGDGDDEDEEIDDIDLESLDRFHINQIVKIRGKRGKAQIRFIGLFDEQLRYGVELLDDMGKHSGVIDGKFYFTCGVFRGMFAPKDDVIYYDQDEEKESNLHNRSHHRLFQNLPDFAGRTGDDSDSDDSITSDSAESVSSVNTLGTVDDSVFERIQLNDDEKDMAFTNILNKFKNVERSQPRPSKLNMTLDTKRLMNGTNGGSPLALIPQMAAEGTNSNNSLGPHGASALSLTLSDTSPIIDKTGTLSDDAPFADYVNHESQPRPHSNSNSHQPQDSNSPRVDAHVADVMDDGYDYNDVGAIVDDDVPVMSDEPTPITPEPQEEPTASNNVAIVVTGMPPPPEHEDDADGNDANQDQESPAEPEDAELPNADRQLSVKVNDIDEEEADQQHRPEVPKMIVTQSEDEKADHVPRDSHALQTPPLSRGLMEVHHGKMASNLLSPLGSELIRHSPVNSEMFDHEDMEPIFNAEESHLKEMPDSPYDVATTQREFANTAQVILLSCNNPHKLFKLLKGITIKLFQESMKYRVLDTNSRRIQVKLLNYEGVEEYLNQLGFKSANNGDKLECPLDQPPLSVLDASVNVCDDYISKTGRKRAVIDMIKRFNPSTLENAIKGTEFDPTSPKHKLLINFPSSDSADDENEKKAQQSNEPVVTIKITEPETAEPDTEKTTQNQPADEQTQDTLSPDNETQTAPHTPLQLHNEMSAEQIEEQEIVDAIFEEGDASGSNDMEEEEEDDDLEGNNDTFRIYDIIASITHVKNSDTSARQIILLCFPTFTDGPQLFSTLDRRFFEGESWQIQTKVISFIQNWMRQYWSEDWSSNPILLNVLEDWFKKIEEHYGTGDADEWKKSKHKKLVDMLVKTIEFQRANARSMSVSAALNPHEPQMERVNQEDKEFAARPFDAKFDFFKLNNTKVARQLTNMDMSYFGSITPRECLGQAWKKKNKYEIARNICALIDHFNRVARWVQLRVLLAQDAKKRGRVIKKFIKICEQLFILRNFQSLYAIYGALYSSCIIRLKKAWHYVPTKHLAKFEEFKVIFATKRNMANLRKLHRETYPPMIPYTGIYLQDLFSIEEGNKKTKTDGSVNFARLLRLSTVIDSILLLQRTTYKINPDKRLQTLLRSELSTNQNVHEDTLWKISDKIHKVDNKKSNFIPIFGASTRSLRH